MLGWDVSAGQRINRIGPHSYPSAAEVGLQGTAWYNSQRNYLLNPFTLSLTFNLFLFVYHSLSKSSGVLDIIPLHLLYK